MVGPCILIGEGSGATIALLGADVAPENVVAVISIEPAGPPFGQAFIKRGDGRHYPGRISHNENVRAYGLSDIPLTYDPAPNFEAPGYSSNSTRPIDIQWCRQQGGTGGCFLQRPLPTYQAADLNSSRRYRQLCQLTKTKHAVITSEASSHSTFDWATVQYMRQAGLSVHWIQLQEHAIHGNGHLCFLEKNSNAIAALILRWIIMNVYTRSGSEDDGSGNLAAKAADTDPKDKGKGAAAPRSSHPISDLQVSIFPISTMPEVLGFLYMPQEFDSLSLHAALPRTPQAAQSTLRSHREMSGESTSTEHGM
jgi:hypothetical protein